MQRQDTTRTDPLRPVLRALKTLSGPFDPFDLDAAAATPQEQFAAWFEAAVSAGVPEPHAMTLSTVGEDGAPDARVLILKDLDARGWHFATASSGVKGRQLASDPRAALTFYWPLLGRQVRIRGVTSPLGAELSARDFRERSPDARATALVGRQSEVLDDPQAFADALRQAQARVAASPDTVAPDWAVYALRATVVEFWQGSPDRRHTRLRYTAGDEGWGRDVLWP